jgi:hypothetical protein
MRSCQSPEQPLDTPRPLRLRVAVSCSASVQNHQERPHDPTLSPVQGTVWLHAKSPATSDAASAHATGAHARGATRRAATTPTPTQTDRHHGHPTNSSTQSGRWPSSTARVRSCRAGRVSASLVASRTRRAVARASSSHVTRSAGGRWEQH